MQSRLAATLAFVIAFGLLATPARSQQTPAEAPRIALVIGVGDYNADGDTRDTDRAQADSEGYVTDLPNALNDASDVASRLKSLSYDVTHVRNPSRAALLQAFISFDDKINAAGRDAKVVIFYAGHGIQVDGVNYLIPAKAQLPAGIDFGTLSSRNSERMMREFAMPLNEMMALLSERGDKGINLVILDACRDNPWDPRIAGGLTRGGNRSRGLADVSVGMSRTIIAFSTKPGATAADGQGRNSPYTTALLRWLGQGNTLPITSMLGRVAGDVERDTTNARGERQITHVSYLGNVEDACLVSCAPSQADEVARLQSALEAAMAAVRTAPTSEPARRSRRQEASQREATTLQRGSAPSSYDTADYAVTLLSQQLQSGRTIADIERGAAAGEGEALYLLAVAKLNGVAGVAVDEVGARGLLRQSTLKGFRRATLTYAGMLFRGEGGPKSVEEAIGWWTSAADEGFPPALHQMGNYYAYSIEPVSERSFAKALPFYQRAAAAGHQGAQVELLDYDWYGRDRPKNTGAALAGYQRLAEQGNSTAMMRLGDAYRFGTNVTKDAARARALYQRAANAGNTDGARALGVWLASGDDDLRADPQAAASLLLSASRTYAEARAALAKLLINKVVPPIPGVDPVAFAISAEEQGYPEGLGALTSNLREGKNGWEKDLKRAAELSRPAYRRGIALPLSAEAAWPLHLKGFAYNIQLALKESLITPETPTELTDLNTRWGEPGGKMKRFTVPTDFNGVSHPFHVYIWDAPNAPVATDAQFDWVEQARGGRVPEDVRESFRKLHKIAKDNNVSFQDLAVYALGAAQQERAGGTAAAGATGTTPVRGSAAARAATPERLRSAQEKIDRAESLRASDRAGALAQLTASIAEVPQASSYRARALIYESMGNIDAAIADYDAAALDDPQNATMHNGRCWMRAVANRDLEAGHSACDRALVLSPGNPEILDSHGLVLFRLGRFEEARGEYDKAVKSGVRNASFLYGRGMALLRLGRTAEGQADLAAAKAMDATIEKTYADFGVRP